MPSIYYGQNAKIEIVSKTHGRFELGYCESFSVDNSLTNKRLYFFNKKEALTISVYEGCSGQFGILDTEEKYLIAALMDVEPSPAVGMLNDDPSAYVSFNVILNAKNESGIIENGIFVKGCRVASAPESMTPRDEQRVQLSYIGATRFKIKGGAIQYVRFKTSASTVYATSDDVTVSGTGPFSGTLPHSATEVNIENNTTTRAYLAIFKNGNDITKDTVALTGFSITGTDVVIPSGSLGNADFWEVFTAYKP